MSKSTIIADIDAKILTGGRRTKAVDTRQILTDMTNQTYNIGDSDADPITDADGIPILQSGETKICKPEQILTYVKQNLQTVEDGITAFPGGGQLNATLLVSTINLVDVCDTAGDSAKLYDGYVSAIREVANNGKFGMNLFAIAGEIIFAFGNIYDDVTPLTIKPNNKYRFVMFHEGIWRMC